MYLFFGGKAGGANENFVRLNFFAKNKIYSRTHPGAIVLLHSNSQTNSEILDEVITHWEEEGYTLKSLDYLTKSKK